MATVATLASCGGGSSGTSAVTGPVQQAQVALASVEADGSTKIANAELNGERLAAQENVDWIAGDGSTTNNPEVVAGTVLLASSQVVSGGNVNQAKAPKLKGVNISGGEYNGAKLGARVNYDYIYPRNVEIDYFASKGMTVIRVPFSSMRLQPLKQGPLNLIEIGLLQNVISYAASKGIRIILDPHDYGKMFDSASGTFKVVGVAGGLPASTLADFWSRMAVAFKAQPNVIFGLMNEPNIQTPLEWKAVAVAAVSAIRAAGATNLILIPGSAWTGAASWVNSGNAPAWAGFKDPGNNFAFEVHQYLDTYSTGSKPDCAPGLGATALNAATLWARTNGYKLFLGETGWASNATCMSEGAALMSYMSSNPDVWSGWTYWAGGAWWNSNYMFLIRPENLASPVDKPQMSTLLNNL